MMTATRAEQLDRLNDIQNTDHYWNRDITTITAFMTDEQVEKHIAASATIAEAAATLKAKGKK